MTVNQTAQELPLVFRIQDWRMAPKLLAAFLAFVILPILIFGLGSVPRVRDTMLEQGSTSMLHDSQSTSERIDQYLNDKREDIVAASKLPEIINYVASPSSAAAKTSAFQALQALVARSDYQSVAIVLSSGKVGVSSSLSDEGTDLAFRPYFIEAMKGTAYISDPSVSVVTNQPAIFFSAPIRDNSDKVIGIVRSRLSLDGIWGLVEKDKNSSGVGTFGTLLDENGIRLASSLSLGNREAVAQTLLYTAVMPVPPQVEKQLVDEKRFGNATAINVRVLPLPEVSAAMTSAGTKSFETTADNSSERHFAAIGSLSAKPWRYVLMTPLSTFTGAADSLRLFQFAILLVVGALAALASIFLARQITHPITQLTNVADRISLGELDAKIEINRKDEIGELAEAVSRMQASLQAAIERLRARRANPS